MTSEITSGFCYDMHELRPANVDCLASWISLTQGSVCTGIFFHLMRKLLRSHKRALAGYAKNTINISSHSKAFSGVILFYILWAISAVFDINRNFKYTELTSPGFVGDDISVLMPLLIGSCTLRGFSNFLEFYVVLLLATDDIGKKSYKFAVVVASVTTILYIICIIVIVMFAPGRTSIYWPLENLAILYTARDFVLALLHAGAWYYSRGLKIDAPVNRTLRKYFVFVAWVYMGFGISRSMLLTDSHFIVNLGICGDDLMRFVQFFAWGPMTYLALKRNCQYWAVDLDLEENEETLKSHTEAMTWSSEATKWTCVIPKTEIYFRKKLEERMDISVELHFWRRRLVVVKRFKFDLLTRENIKLFKNEATVFKQLVHPNIVSFFGVLVDPPSLGIVMDYASNGDLMQYMEKQLASVDKKKEKAQAKMHKREAENPHALPEPPAPPKPRQWSTGVQEDDEIPSPPPSPMRRDSSIMLRSLQALKNGVSSPFKSPAKDNKRSVASIEMSDMAPKPKFNSWTCARQVADAMAYLHENNIHHLDLKSPNVLLGSNYEALIADFGESKIHTHAGATDRGSISLRSSLSSSHKGEDDTTGTPGWAAPECINGKGAHPLSDAFSFGIILWELVCWRPPSVLVSVADLKTKPSCNLPGIPELIAYCDSVDAPAAAGDGNESTQSPLHHTGTRLSMGTDSATVWQENPVKAKLNLMSSSASGKSDGSGKSGKNDDKLLLVEISDALRAQLFMCEQKRRPPIPKSAPQWLHTLLSRCWFENPEKRPTFAEIRSILDSTADANAFIELPYDL